MKHRLCRMILAACSIVDGVATLVALGQDIPSLTCKVMWKMADSAWYWR